MAYNENAFERCAICQFRSNRNKISKGAWYCTVHYQKELDRDTATRESKNFEKFKSERTAAFVEKEILYDP